MGESTEIIQVLLIVACILAGIWRSIRKAAKKVNDRIDRTDDRTFEWQLPDYDIDTDVDVHVHVDDGYAMSDDRMAVRSIESIPMEEEGINDSMDTLEDGEVMVEVNACDMVIYSELMNPKYKEY